jgi:uncharacterized tellurite resistance protein B-like protein
MRVPFASRLVQRVATALQRARVGALGAEEKHALVQLLGGVARADGVISADEQRVLDDAARALGVSAELDEADELDTAVATLARHPRTLRLACLVVADAFFVDGDYDGDEKEFVTSFQQRFSLPANPLQDAVEALRKQKLDAALDVWNREIAAG